MAMVPLCLMVHSQVAVLLLPVDHTTGLYKSFSAGTIYASQGTARLVTELIGVNAERVVGLPMNRPVMVAGFELTLVDANHCPAAVMFLIRDPRPGGRLCLHTGDFRADESVCANPAVASLRGRLDTLFLDTTYCAPHHTFPTQHVVLAEVDRLVRTELERDPNTLFLVGTYSIGKEKVLEVVAKAARSRCLVTSRKARIMRLSGAWDDYAYTTHDASTGGGMDGAGYARVRAVPLQVTNSPVVLRGALTEARASGAPFTSVVGVRPTGWTHTNGRKSSGNKNMASARAGGRRRGDGGGIREMLSGADKLEEGEGEGSRDSRPCKVNATAGGAESADGDDRGDEAAAWGAGGASEEEEEEEQYGGEEGERPGATEASPEAVDSFGAKKPWVEGNARMYSVPYSEHSSFPQLKDFVRVVRPKAIIPTVNSASAASVERMLRHFFEFMDLSRDRKRLDSYFCKRPSPPGGSKCAVVDLPASAPICPTSTAERPLPTSAEDVPEPQIVSNKRLPEIERAGEPVARVQRPFKARRAQPSSPSFALAPMADRGNRRTKRGALLQHPAQVVAVELCAGGASPIASYSMPDSPGCALSATGTVDAGRAGASCFGAAEAPATVELSHVDVEAQKAIMADIERRKREQQREARARARGVRFKACSSSENPAEDNIIAVEAGGDSAASAVRITTTGKGGVRGSETPTGAKRGPKTAALWEGRERVAAGVGKMPAEANSERGQRTLIVAEKSDTSPTGTMNIRDFFSRRR